MSVSPINRRDFVRLATRSLLAISGLVGLGGLIRYFSYQPEPPPPRVYEVGVEEDFPLHSRTLLPSIPAILIHTSGGFHALSLVCSHLGCTVQDQLDNLACPCHGSRFDDAGNVTKRPAGSPLRSLDVEVSADGKVKVHL